MLNGRLSSNGWVKKLVFISQKVYRFPPSPAATDTPAAAGLSRHVQLQVLVIRWISGRWDFTAGVSILFSLLQTTIMICRCFHSMVWSSTAETLVKSLSARSHFDDGGLKFHTQICLSVQNGFIYFYFHLLPHPIRTHPLNAISMVVLIWCGCSLPDQLPTKLSDKVLLLNCQSEEEEWCPRFEFTTCNSRFAFLFLALTPTFNRSPVWHFQISRDTCFLQWNDWKRVSSLNSQPEKRIADLKLSGTSSKNEVRR